MNSYHHLKYISFHNLIVIFLSQATSSKPSPDIATTTSTQKSSQIPSENATSIPTESLETKLNTSTKVNIAGR